MALLSGSKNQELASKGSGSTELRSDVMPTIGMSMGGPLVATKSPKTSSNGFEPKSAWRESVDIWLTGKTEGLEALSNGMIKVERAEVWQLCGRDCG